MWVWFLITERRYIAWRNNAISGGVCTIGKTSDLRWWVKPLEDKHAERRIDWITIYYITSPSFPLSLPFPPSFHCPYTMSRIHSVTQTLVHSAAHTPGFLNTRHSYAWHRDHSVTGYYDVYRFICKPSAPPGTLHCLYPQPLEHSTRNE